MIDTELLTNFVTELKRGSLTLAILLSLKNSHYGYELLQILQDKNIEIEANTLYPLMRRLESQELLESDWDTTESRPRKYYKTSFKGQELLKALLKEWKKIQDSIDVLEGETNNE